MILLEICLPTFQKQNVKDTIITILGRQWPLTAKKIFNLIKKNYSLGVTYQAVHKSLLALLEQKIIINSKLGYSINLQWINQISAFTDRIKSNYSDSSDILAKDFSSFTFNTFYDKDRFLMLLLYDLLNKDDVGLFCSSSRHFTWPLYFTKDIYGGMRAIKCPEKIYTVCSSNSNQDRWSLSVFKKLGLNSKVDVRLENFEFMVYQDLVIQIHFPENCFGSIDDIFSQNLVEVDYSALSEQLFERKLNIQVLIFRNKVLAERLRQKVLNLFKN